MTNDQLSLVRSLVAEILRRDGPQPGARLKTELNFAYLSKTGQPFHERLLGFAKFSQLIQAQVDVFVVERPTAGPGDVIVRLRESPSASTWSGALGHEQGGSDQHAPAWPVSTRAAGSMIGPRVTPQAKQSWLISKPLWSAFINPDPNRERYLHRPTGEVLTFSRLSTKNVDAMLRQRFEMLRADCVPIDFIRFDVQVGWMEEFVRSKLPEGSREGALLEVHRLNQWTAQTGFLNLLGYERAEDWRQFRFEKVISRIREWLTANGLPESVMMSAVPPPGAISHPPVPPSVPRGREAGAPAATPVQAAVGGRPSMRDLLHALIDTLPDDQLDSVLVPGSAVARLSSILRSVRG